MKTRTERITLAGMLLALGILLPFATAHGLGIPGTVLLPMHIPVFLSALLTGPFFGAVTGLLLPLLNCLFTGMPAFYPMLPIMTAELFVYGLVCGLLYHKTPLGRNKWGAPIALVCAMLAGRVAYGLVFHLLFFLTGELKALSVTAAVLTGIPGILIQLLLVPTLFFFVEEYFRRDKAGVIASAKNLIRSDRASCAVIRDGAIEAIETGKGIAPILKMLDEDRLSGATVIDKIVGRAAALVMLAGGVRACHACTASEGAIALFARHGIPFTYEEKTAAIINREGNGPCPMEAAAAAIDDPATAVTAIRKTLAALRAVKS